MPSSYQHSIAIHLSTLWPCLSTPTPPPDHTPHHTLTIFTPGLYGHAQILALNLSSVYRQCGVLPSETGDNVCSTCDCQETTSKYLFSPSPSPPYPLPPPLISHTYIAVCTCMCMYTKAHIIVSPIESETVLLCVDLRIQHLFLLLQYITISNQIQV